MGTDIHGVFQKRNGEKWEDVPSEYTQDRHYLLFAWIGNVRNGFGCAGVPTHTPVIPLSDGRGYPEGFEVEDDQHSIASLDIMDPSRRKWHEAGEPLEIWMGDHSHSWLSGEEILSAECPKITRTGIISLDQFRKWDGKTAPESWCGGTSGPGVLVSTPDTITDKTTDVQISWEENTKESLSYFVDEVRRLTELHGEIRFVFGFDS